MAEGGSSEERFKFTISSGSDIMYDFYCELCKDDEKNVEAEGYCIDCEEYFCGTCYSGHTRSRHTRYHKLLDKDSMPKDKPLSYDRVSRFISTMCPVHSEKPVEYFCKAHNFLGCGACFLKSHKGCQDFESVLEKSESILASNEYKELLQNMKFISQRSNDMGETARDNIKEVKACYSKEIESINTLKDQVVATFERLAKDVTSKAALLVLEEERKMTTLSAKCSSISDSVNSLLEHFQSLESSKRVCQIYISMKQNRENIDKLLAELYPNEKTLTVRKFRFEPDLKFQEIVDNANTLGKFMVEKFVNRERLGEPKPQTLSKTNDVTDIDHSRSCTMPTLETGTSIVSRSKAVQVYCSQNAYHQNGFVNEFCKWLNPIGYEIHVRRAYSEVERKMPLIVLCYNANAMEAMKEVLAGRPMTQVRRVTKACSMQ